MQAKTPILLIHGAWHGSWCWQEFFVPFLQNQGFDCRVVDLPEHGAQRSKANLNHLWMDHYLQFLRQEISHYPEAPVLVGHSLGGYLVQRLLEERRYPAAVLMAPVPIHGLWLTLLRLFLRNPLQSLAMLIQEDVSGLVKTPKMYKQNFFHSALKEEDLNRFFNRLGPESFWVFMETLFRWPVPSKGRTPMLVLGAEKDRFFNKLEILRTAKKQEADAILFAETGHGMMLEENWQEIAQSIVDWLHRKVSHDVRSAQSSFFAV